MKERSFITKILHAGFLKKDPHGSMHMPIYDNVAFEFDTAEDIANAFQGKKPAHMYSRISNPTVEHFEQKIRVVTGAVGVVALSSGMAAIANTIIAIAQSGENIVTSKHLFGNTFSLFEKTLKAWGLESKYVDMTDPAQVEAAVDDKTRAIFFETITNPQIEVADVKALSDIAKKHDLVLIADTTISPPYLFDSKAHGVDIEVLSSTKYISGGATSVGGLIIDYGSYDWGKIDKLKEFSKKFGEFALISKLRKEVYRNLGACMSPHNAYLQTIGLETLVLRIDASCENAQAVAEYLDKSKKVISVNYPGLKGSISHEISKKQFNGKYGALLTFELESIDQCFKFENKLEIIKRATNLNDNRTLIIHPESTIFCEFDDALKEEMNVRKTTLRIAVGIEDINDLINDIENALEAI